MADTILALLEPGEYVINRNAAKKIGKEALDDLNYNMMPRFQSGGNVAGKRPMLDFTQINPRRLGALLGGSGGHNVFRGALGDAMWNRESFVEDSLEESGMEMYEGGWEEAFDKAVPVKSYEVEDAIKTLKNLSRKRKSMGRDEYDKLIEAETSKLSGPLKELYKQDPRYFDSSSYLIPEEGEGVLPYYPYHRFEPHEGESFSRKVRRVFGKSLPEYQTGGPVSYGGYESDLPSLDALYEQFGIQPNAENLKRFEEYDPSREGVYREDYLTSMGGLETAGQRELGSAYGATREGGGGFAGSGFGESTLSKARKSMMQDYLQGQRGAYSTMFKGVRGERERWMTEMGSQLGALEEAGGTDTYLTTHTGPTGNEGWPNQAAYDQWVAAGRPENATAYGFGGDGDPNIPPGGGTGDKTTYYGGP